MTIGRALAYLFILVLVALAVLFSWWTIQTWRTDDPEYFATGCVIFFWVSWMTNLVIKWRGRNHA